MSNHQGVACSVVCVQGTRTAPYLHPQHKGARQKPPDTHQEVRPYCRAVACNLAKSGCGDNMLWRPALEACQLRKQTHAPGDLHVLPLPPPCSSRRLSPLSASCPPHGHQLYVVLRAAMPDLDCMQQHPHVHKCNHCCCTATLAVVQPTLFPKVQPIVSNSTM